jgi:hypothetical protein
MMVVRTRQIASTYKTSPTPPSTGQIDIDGAIMRVCLGVDQAWLQAQAARPPLGRYRPAKGLGPLEIPQNAWAGSSTVTLSPRMRPASTKVSSASTMPRSLTAPPLTARGKRCRQPKAVLPATPQRSAEAVTVSQRDNENWARHAPFLHDDVRRLQCWRWRMPSTSRSYSRGAHSMLAGVA